MGKIDTVILAAIGGFVAGVLLAPKSGKETREDLMNKKNEYQEKANDSIATIKRGAASIKDDLVSSGEEVKDIAKDVSGRVRREAEDTAETVKRNAR